MSPSSATRRDLAVLVILCVLSFWLGLGRLGLIDPDEPFYALSAKEMLAAGDWSTPRIFGQPQFEKPIGFYWLEMASFSAFGRNEFAARAPAALFGSLLVLLTYLFAARAFGRRAGLLAGLVLATTVSYVVTSRMVLTDVVFAFFVCGACFASVAGVRTDRRETLWWLLASACAGIAGLVKGPLGALIPTLATATFAWTSRRPLGLTRRAAALGVALGLAIAAPWYVLMIARHGWTFVQSFIIHENFERLVVAEHPSNNHPFYYVALLVAGSLPWLPALLLSLARARDPEGPDGTGLFLKGWIASGLVFFTLAASKLPTYVLFLSVPISILIGRTLDALLREGYRSREERWLATAAGVAQAAALLGGLVAREARVIYLPIVMAAVCLTLAALLQRHRPTIAGVGATALATLLLIVSLASWATRPLEGMLSVREMASHIGPASGNAEPVLATPILVRGLNYYTGISPRVVARKPRAFFTPHPIPVVVGVAGLRSFVRETGPTRCLLRESEWRRYARGLPKSMIADSLVLGDRVLIRLLPDSSAAAARSASGAPVAMRTLR
jgi:4-amino-4-deoxy-L-arabinose transferase-like glycosyltransferase